MRMKTNGWRPENCGCDFEYEYDLDLPNDQRVVTFKRAVKLCAAHQSMTELAAYNASQNQGARLDKLCKRLKEQFVGTLSDAIIDSDGNNTYYEFKSGIGVSWSFTGTGADRVLSASILGYNLSGSQRNQAQTWCDNTFGVGKVVIG